MPMDPVKRAKELAREVCQSHVHPNVDRLQELVERALLQFGADVLVETHGDTAFGRVALATELRKVAEER